MLATNVMYEITEFHGSSSSDQSTFRCHHAAILRRVKME
jgi:hypothetical protein